MIRLLCGKGKIQKKKRVAGMFPLLIVSLVLMVGASGCAPVQEKPIKRFFWPIMSPEPKIEFIDYYRTDYKVKKGSESAFTEAILGREKPRPLFSHPFSVASDGKGRVFVADHGKHKVWILDLSRHKIRTLLNQKGETYLFRIPVGIALTPEGDIFVSDSSGGVVVRFGGDEKKKYQIRSDRLIRPTGLAYDADQKKLYVVDTEQHKVLAFDEEGNYLHALGERGNGPGQFNFPNDVAVDGEGNVIVLDALNARVQVFDASGTFLRAFGERGTAIGSFAMPKGIAVDSEGHIYVTDALGHKIVVFDLQGQYLLTIGAKHVIADEKGVSPGGFYLPQGIDVDSQDGIWVCDSLNKAVYKFQYLNQVYLEKNPITPDDFYFQPASQPARGPEATGTIDKD